MSGATTGKVSIYNLEKKAYLNQRVGLFKAIKPSLINYFNGLLTVANVAGRRGLPLTPARRSRAFRRACRDGAGCRRRWSGGRRTAAGRRSGCTRGSGPRAGGVRSKNAVRHRRFPRDRQRDGYHRLPLPHRRTAHRKNHWSAGWGKDHSDIQG